MTERHLLWYTKKRGVAIKNKKRLLIVFISLSLVLRLLLGSLPFLLYGLIVTPKFEGSFSAESYGSYMEEERYQSDLTYGTIENKTDAVKAAKKAFSDRFDEKATLLNPRMYSIYHDKEADVWLVESHPLAMGGGLHLLLDSDGTVLAIWGTK